MKIKISPEVKTEVSFSLIEFVKSVIEGERLTDWNVHIWACRGEGLCDDTTIIFGLCETEIKTKLLFLHEVAHALRIHIDWDDSYWHREGWDSEYWRLSREYLGITVRDYKGVRKLFAPPVRGREE